MREIMEKIPDAYLALKRVFSSDFVRMKITKNNNVRICFARPLPLEPRLYEPLKILTTDELISTIDYFEKDADFKIGVWNPVMYESTVRLSSMRHVFLRNGIADTDDLGHINFNKEMYREANAYLDQLEKTDVKYKPFVEDCCVSKTFANYSYSYSFLF